MSKKEFHAWLDEIMKTHNYCDHHYSQLLPLLQVCGYLFDAFESGPHPLIDDKMLREMMKPVPP